MHPQRASGLKQDKLAKIQGEWFQLLFELLSVGFSLKQAVNFSGTLMPKSQGIINLVNDRLAEGYSFAQSIQPLVKVDIYYQLMLAEEHGALVNTLSSISEFYRLCSQQKKKMHGLLEYPLILLAMLTMIGCAMRGWLVPEMQSLQADTMPNWWTAVGYACGGAIVVLLVLFFAQLLCYYRRSRISQVEYLCHLPIFGRGFCDYYAYYVCGNLSLLVSEGISEQKIVAYLKQYQKKSLLHQLAVAYEETNYDLDTMIHRYRCLPSELGLLVKCGLTNDEQAKRLQILSQMKFKHLVQLTEHWLTVLQPLLLGTIALIVLGLYLSILLPIYHSMQGVVQ